MKISIAFTDQPNQLENKTKMILIVTEDPFMKTYSMSVVINTLKLKS